MFIVTSILQVGKKSNEKLNEYIFWAAMNFEMVHYKYTNPKSTWPISSVDDAHLK
jgi:hypothetical protein